VSAKTGILVVDDRAENLQALEAVLEPLGCRVVTAASGKQALKLLLEEQFAVILLDVQMPEMDGFETASYIRDRHRTRSIPIIFLSAASTSAEHVFRGYEAGAVDYIVKPIEPVAIRSKVRVFLELHERGEEILRQSEILRLRDLERAQRETERRRHRRTVLLDSLSVALERHMDIDGRITELVRACVPTLAEFALAELAPAERRRASVAFACASDADQKSLVPFVPLHDGSRGDEERRGRLETSVTRESWLESVPETFGERVWKRIEPSSMIVFPLRLQGRRLGRLVLVRSRGATYTDEEFELVAELAKRASMALETSRLYELERERSRILQLSLLGESQLAHPVVNSASRYIPGSADLEVGGDWCDLIERDDGRIFAVVGDVVGRGIRAATAMGKLRSAIGALALVTDDTAELLARLDRFAAGIPEADLATVICALIDPASGEVLYSSAGHLPALVVRPGGETELLENGRGFPLGVDVTALREQGRTTLDTGSTLLLFTDGVVEARDQPIDVGIERLRRTAGERWASEPERACDEIVEELVDGPGDDAALVCLRMVPEPDDFTVWRFPALANRVPSARHGLVDWLVGKNVAPDIRSDLMLAFTEACTNAVSHAYRDGDGTVVTQLRLDDGNLTIRVSDTGRWSDRREIGSTGGWGLEIIRALVDSAHVHGTPHGTTVIMQKRLAPARARQGLTLDAASAVGHLR
jgi:CheY-like chemotaxis protein/serine phosphatase RsbU (regulator of sigma subunit)/anti-sigma regulatory factor (Ser/Thr protein kinase)